MAPARGTIARTMTGSEQDPRNQVEVPAVRLKDLVKDFPAPAGAEPGAADTLRAVDGLSLEIEQGSFYGLLGPNGAGKSTTIHILTSLARRTSGVAEVLGHDVSRDFRTVRRSIGLSPQEPSFDQFLSCREILVYQGMYFEMPRADARRRADELLEAFELTHKRRNRVQELSGGQRRRLSIAKALVHDPPILILDEPTAGIDVALRHHLWDYLREENARGKTILLTTHYIEEAQALCDRVGIIDQGRLVREGSPEELMAAGAGDRVVVTLMEPLDEDAHPVAAITDASGCDCTLMPDGVTLVASGDRAGPVSARVLGVLNERGVRVESIDIRRRSLEEAFVQAVGGEIAPDGTIQRHARKVTGGNV